MATILQMTFLNVFSWMKFFFIVINHKISLVVGKFLSKHPIDNVSTGSGITGNP